MGGIVESHAPGVVIRGEGCISEKPVRRFVLSRDSGDRISCFHVNVTKYLDNLIDPFIFWPCMVDNTLDSLDWILQGLFLWLLPPSHLWPPRPQWAIRPPRRLLRLLPSDPRRAFLASFQKLKNAHHLKLQNIQYTVMLRVMPRGLRNLENDLSTVLSSRIQFLYHSVSLD